MGTNHKKKHSSQFTTPESSSLLLLLDCSSYQVHITQFTGLFPHDTVHETESTKLSPRNDWHIDEGACKGPSNASGVQLRSGCAIGGRQSEKQLMVRMMGDIQGSANQDIKGRSEVVGCWPHKGTKVHEGQAARTTLFGFDQAQFWVFA